MSSFTDSGRKANVTLKLSEFEMPPMQDVLIVGKKAPIGPEAAKRMVDILSPNQYEVILVDHPIIEATVVRKTIMNMVPRDRLVSFILEEGGKVANESTILKAQLNVVLCVSKSIEL